MESKIYLNLCKNNCCPSVSFEVKDNKVNAILKEDDIVFPLNEENIQILITEYNRFCESRQK